MTTAIPDFSSTRIPLPDEADSLESFRFCVYQLLPRAPDPGLETAWVEGLIDCGYLAESSPAEAAGCIALARLLVDGRRS
jgi:hypothetical protein